MAKLKMVRLEEVAQYLECNPKKLSIALKHLSTVKSGIWYSKDAAVIIGPGVRPVEPTPEQAAKAAAEVASMTAWNNLVQEETNKLLREAADRLDAKDDGTGRNYSFEEVIVEATAYRAAEKAAEQGAIVPALTRYRTMKPADEKWRN
jgi:hypothetical protein